MSSTRHASDGRMRQSGFASAPEFEGDAINGFLAAKRISLIEDEQTRASLWFVQWRSLQPHGLRTLARELIARFPERIGTEALFKLQRANKTQLLEREARELWCSWPGSALSLEQLCSDFSDTAQRHVATELGSRADFENQIREHAEDVLPDRLKRLCLDPKYDLSDSLWFFADLPGALTALRREHVAAARSRLADTAVSREMFRALDFCADQRRMVLIEGVAGIGRTATAHAWADSHAGLVRYVETPSSNDARSFYVAFAQALGVARGFSFNTQQIKNRVEETLRESGLIIALDEAQYCWPQYARPQGLPSRMLWIKTVFDAGTPFALVAHADFSRWQELYVKKSLWTDEQFDRRLNRRVLLPPQHSAEDMLKIARAHFPEGDERSWKALAGYAMAAPKKQASGIVEALHSALHRAKNAGRAAPTFADIRAAVMTDHLGADGALLTDASTDSAEPLQRSCRPVAVALKPAADRARRPATGAERAERRATILNSAG